MTDNTPDTHAAIGNHLNTAINTYIGRFAPSPTGPLHLGSLVAAMASYLDARVHRGKWLLRIEDLDFDRNVKDAAPHIIHSLQRCGMHWDGDISWQSQRQALYEQALQQLGNHIYACGCSRKEIADSRLRTGEPASQIYPGTCRHGLAPGKTARAWRLRISGEKISAEQGETTELTKSKESKESKEPTERTEPQKIIRFQDRFCGWQQQNLSTEVGDFVLKRADGFWAYQLAVVVDDAAQGITHIVRGADLIDSTARQLYLQELLQLPTPAYLHVPVVTNADGEKLSKQTGAMAFDRGENDLLHEALIPAARLLGLPVSLSLTDITSFWAEASILWENKLNF
ncbi:tRNA glutamyl-Q(34) synthetase GluQRS [Undibacterium sp. SXout7W]|uniref:tRNA glutamyl-Q(34) synthetase GluQRS n=1 Tax=Undibacterium sp. SXout7W TaxID=3413049 RepID=UPI003BF2CCD8